jgi:hypothetical protein
MFVLEYIGLIEYSKGLLCIPNKYCHFFKNDRLLKNKIVLMFMDKWMLDDSFENCFNKDTAFLKKWQYLFGMHNKPFEYSISPIYSKTNNPPSKIVLSSICLLIKKSLISSLL